MADDEILSLVELAAAIRRNEPTSAYTKNSLHPYGCKVLLDGQHKWMFGNPKAIASLKRKIGSL